MLYYIRIIEDKLENNSVNGQTKKIEIIEFSIPFNKYIIIKQKFLF